MILCEYGNKEGEEMERTVKGRQVIGSLEIKKNVSNSIIFKTGMQHMNHMLAVN